MSAAELANVQPGDDLYVRVRLIEHHGDDLIVSIGHRRTLLPVQINASEVISFAPLTLKRSGQVMALRLSDCDVKPGASTWATANQQR